MCSHCSKLRNYITKLQQDAEQLKCQVANLKEEIKRIQSKRFTIKDIEHSDDLVQLYTGLQIVKVFEFLADNLRDKAVRLHYVRGSESKGPPARGKWKEIWPREKILRGRGVFLWLRQGLSEEDLAFRMKVFQSTVSRIVTT